MKKIYMYMLMLAVVVSCGLSEVAHAGGNVINHHNNNSYITNGGGQGGQGGQGGVGIGVGGNASSAANANNSLEVTTVQGQLQGQSLTYTEAKQDYSEMYDDYTPSAYAPSVNATVPCLVPISAGVGVPGVSVSGGSGVIDQGCEDREIIRLGLASDDARTWRLANQALRTQLSDLLVRQETERLEADIKAEKAAEDKATADAYGWFNE